MEVDCERCVSTGDRWSGAATVVGERTTDAPEPTAVECADGAPPTPG